MKLLQKLQSYWKPNPLDPPTVDPELPHRDAVTRSAESICYGILSLEFWISPHGQVREWLKHNTRLAAWLAIPAFMVLPLIVFILWQVVKGVEFLTSIAGHLIILPFIVLVALVAILVVVSIIKVLLR